MQLHSITGGFILILIALYCCRGRLAGCYERCITVGSKSQKDNDEETPGCFARMCGCCSRRNDDTDDEEEEDEDDKDKKKKGAKSARSWGKPLIRRLSLPLFSHSLSYPLSHFFSHSFLLCSSDRIW